MILMNRTVWEIYDRQGSGLYACEKNGECCYSKIVGGWIGWKCNGMVVYTYFFLLLFAILSFHFYTLFSLLVENATTWSFFFFSFWFLTLFSNIPPSRPMYSFYIYRNFYWKFFFIYIFLKGMRGMNSDGHSVQIQLPWTFSSENHEK